MHNDPNDYLSNTTADHRLLGAGPLLSPESESISSQRGMMFSNHLTQTQIIAGPEFPQHFTGYETEFLRHAKNDTKRLTDVRIIAVVPKYETSRGYESIKETPSYILIVSNVDTGNSLVPDNQIDYIELSTYTMLAKGYGYRNKWNTALLPISEGQLLTRDAVLSTSPAVDGNKYMLGTNLNTAYMSLPQVAEDAFVISETAAKKLSTTTVDQVVLELRLDQLPLNLYGTDDEYRFMPDIGDTVREDGVLCAIRTPSAESMAFDVVPQHLTQIQHLNDEVYYAPPGATIVDIDVDINAKVSDNDRFDKEILGQALKYYENRLIGYNRLYEIYHTCEEHRYPISNRANQLFSSAMEHLLAAKRGLTRSNYNNTPDLTLVRKKKPLEFICIKITYMVANPIKRGYKLTGRCGNKL